MHPILNHFTSPTPRRQIRKTSAHRAEIAAPELRAPLPPARDRGS